MQGSILLYVTIQQCNMNEVWQSVLRQQLAKLATVLIRLRARSVQLSASALQITATSSAL